MDARDKVLLKIRESVEAPLWLQINLLKTQLEALLRLNQDLADKAGKLELTLVEEKVIHAQQVRAMHVYAEDLKAQIDSASR